MMGSIIVVFLFLLTLANNGKPNKADAFISLNNCIDEQPGQTLSNKQPLRVLTSSLAPVIIVTWNSTGHVTNLTGFAPYMLHLIAQRIGSTYCWVPLGRDMPFDDSLGNKGLISQLVEGKGDLLVGTLVRTSERLKLIDFTMPTLEAPFSIMIPFPELSVNKDALGQPFQPQVWINLLFAVIFVIFGLYAFNIASKRIIENDSGLKENHARVSLYDAFTYVITLLLTQGNFYSNQKTGSRFIAGAWCLAALILVSAYSGTLLSFIMSPVRKPVINSIYDIANVPGLRVALDRGRAADMQIESNGKDKTSNFGKVVTVIQKTMFRCNASVECIDKVLTGSYVYIHGKPAVNQMIVDDLAKVGKCRFTEAKEAFLNGYLSWGMPKKTRLHDAVNNAILELDAFGISTFWKAKFSKVAKKCINAEEPIKSDQLSLSHLSGIFVVLGIGYALGILVFIFEKIVGYFKQHNKNRQQEVARKPFAY